MKNHRAFRLSREELVWVRRNFANYTSRQLFDQIMANRPEHKRAKYTTFRNCLYGKGLKKCEIIRWTKPETKFLLDNYRTTGNIEIAAQLSTKDRKFTKKKIEKKMKLLGIKRTEAERKLIKDKHIKEGRFSTANKRWENRRAPEGAKKTKYVNGRPFIAIKVDGLFVRYARYRYEQIHGRLPRGVKVFHKDMDPLNIEDENLVARRRGLTREERRLYDKNCRKHIESLEAPPPLRPEIKKTNDHTVQKIPVRLDSRTIVYVQPGTNIEALRRKHEQRDYLKI